MTRKQELKEKKAELKIRLNDTLRTLQEIGTRLDDAEDFGQYADLQKTISDFLTDSMEEWSMTPYVDREKQKAYMRDYARRQREKLKAYEAREKKEKQRGKWQHEVETMQKM